MLSNGRAKYRFASALTSATRAINRNEGYYTTR